MLQSLEHQATRLEQHRRLEVLEQVQSKPILPGTMRAVLEFIAPANMHGRRAYLLELLLGKLTWGAVRHWAADRTTPPHWAREILKEKLRQQVTELQSLIERLG